MKTFAYRCLNRLFTGFIIFVMLLFSVIQRLNAQTTFEEVSAEAGIDIVMNSINLFGSGAAFFDYNNDGNLDLYVTGGNTKDDILYQGDGQGNFTDVTAEAGLSFTSTLTTYGVTTGDVDNDGDRDIFLCTGFGSPSNLFLNNGDGTFTDISENAGFTDDNRHKHGAVFGDVNLDGYLDIYITSWVETFKAIKNAANETIGYAHDCFSDLLYINNGDLTFTESSSAYGIDNAGCGLVPAFSDYDNDGDMDGFIVNDFGPWVEPNGLYRNEFPLDTFSDVSISSNMNQAVYGMGIAIGDYDHDLDLDYYITSIDSNRFMQNQGDGTFKDIARQLGVEDDTLDGTDIVKTSWGTAFFDVDNDRYDDLFVANGKVGVFIPNANDDPDRLFLNNRAGGFTDVTDESGLGKEWSCRAMCYGDYDNDGDLDIFIHVSRRDSTRDGHSLLYENKLELNSEQNWLQVSLTGVKANRDGFGAHIQIHVGSDTWLREIDGGSSYRSQHASYAHFGLGSATMVDSLIITWPGGRKQRAYAIAANQRMEIIEDTIPPVGVKQLKVSLISDFSLFPNPSNGLINLSAIVNTTSTAQWEIHDILGKKKHEGTIQLNKGKNAKPLDCSTLSPGLYSFILHCGHDRIVRKIIIQ